MRPHRSSPQEVEGAAFAFAGDRGGGERRRDQGQERHLDQRERGKQQLADLERLEATPTLVGDEDALDAEDKPTNEQEIRPEDDKGAAAAHPNPQLPAKDRVRPEPQRF